jgi:4-phospho-D-threonate 3-dehydrogenase / 4-phospho-D-erythronate 3-dehydrogenase
VDRTVKAGRLYRKIPVRLSSRGAKKNAVLGITLGDPAGVGPELVREAIRRMGRSYQLRIIGESVGVRGGQPTLKGARMAMEALQESVRLLKSGEIAGVVNGPVSKDWLRRVGFRFPGQTEFYAKAFGLKGSEVTMMMIGPRLRVALVSTHLSLKKAVNNLSKGGIVRAGVHLAETLGRMGFRKPRIAVCGLNPHAGEGGLFGNEERKVVEPAVRELSKKVGLKVWGPESPDTVFWRAGKGEFDGVVALYHDQGLIPAKLLDFETTVNVTVGLPVVRCSPDHGTAFDLAGKGKAKADSLMAAIRLAGQLAGCGPR